ncbi:hypothetical protein F383_37958 [Gossypium arboreum]|uniref:Uncharacterized protein n=1 Tax=Gossypium arboreum TaxID=29729 RepID=A0A0B0MDR9_GOSAR|nr:hypothetical protein F383_37958 [Gossypium arboreum]
MQPTIQYT